jgi:putative transposase
MKGKRHSPEQVVRKLREADRLLAEGADVDAVCRHLEVSVQTYQRWRSQYRAMRPEDVVRLKALEKENARLKRIVGEQALDIDMLREVARGRMKVKSPYAPALLVDGASRRRCVGRRLRRVRRSGARACVALRG